MRLTERIGIGLIILVSCIAVATTALRARNEKNTGQTEVSKLRVVAKQLPAENGVIPVELQCGAVNLKAPSTFEGFSCIVKNNTQKSITALAAAYTVITENNGQRSSDTALLTSDSFIHEDVREARHLKSVAPGGVDTLQPTGSLAYENAKIVGVEIKMDYVEFEDKTTLGPDVNGSRAINLMREGAAKYKEWLVRRYLQNGRSVNAILPLLQEPHLPDELKFNDRNLKQGAGIYQQQILHAYNAQGVAELEKFLNR